MKYARQRLHGIVVEIGYANTYEAQARSWAQGQPGISIYIKFWASLRIKNRTDWIWVQRSWIQMKWLSLVSLSSAWEEGQMQLCAQKQAHMFTLQVAMPEIPVTGTEKQEDWVPAQPRIRKRLFSQTTTWWGCSSMTKCFTSMPKTLGLIPSTAKKTRTEKWSYWLAPFIVTH